MESTDTNTRARKKKLQIIIRFSLFAQQTSHGCNFVFINYMHMDMNKLRLRYWTVEPQKGEVMDDRGDSDV